MITVYDKKHSIEWELHKKCNVLLGNNGIGKTTFMDLISGIMTDDNIKISGNESLVYMNQSLFFFDRLKVADNVNFFYRLAGIKNTYSHIEAFNKKTGNYFNIKDLWQQQIGYLSGGEKKLIYFLMLLSMDFEWYLLDEPFAGIDKDNRKYMKGIIDRRITEGRGFIIVSHQEEYLDDLKEYVPYNIKDIPIEWKYKKTVNH